jgi:hypothetical protein
MNTLNFKTYVGGKGISVDRSGLADVATPEPDGRWHPIPHSLLVDQVDNALQSLNMRIVHDTYKLDNNGARMFGMLQIANCKDDGDFSFVAGVRNAHDKALRAGLAVGLGVTVCSNLQFRGEIVIGTKHTTNILERLPLLVNEAIGQLASKWDAEGERVNTYKGYEVTTTQGHELLIKAARAEVFPRTQFMDVVDEWEHPRHPEFQAPTMWSLFNAVTEHLKPRENSSGSTLWQLPNRTERLHAICDATCGLEVLQPA